MITMLLTGVRANPRLRRARKFLTLTAMLCATLVVAWTPQTVRAQQQVAFIIDVRGNWYLSGAGGRGLTRGQSLPAKGRIGIQFPSDDDYIVISDLKGRPIIKRQCNARADCEGWITLPAAPQKPGYLAAGYSAVMRLIWGEPDRYAANRARDGELADAVVELKGEQVDLSEVFQKSAKGSYPLRLRSLERGSNATNKHFGPIVFNWQGSQPTNLSLAGLKPGLYELKLLERLDDVYTATGVTAWILVAPAASFRKTSESFQAAVQLTKEWGENVTPDASRGFLRAQLDQLAMRPPR